MAVCGSCEKIMPKFATDETETINADLKRKSSSEESLLTSSSKKKKVETVVIDTVDKPTLTRFEFLESDEDDPTDPTYVPEGVITRSLRSGLRSSRSRSPLKVSQRNKRSRLETSPVNYLIVNTDTEEEEGM
jgi:hypothetical protein